MRKGNVLASMLTVFGVVSPSYAMVQNSNAQTGTCISFSEGKSEIDESGVAALDELIERVKSRSPFDGIHMNFRPHFVIGEDNHLATEREKAVIKFVHDKAPELLLNNIVINGNAGLVTYKCEAEINFFFKTVCDNVTHVCTVKDP